nr:hypothetical protein J3459_015782 [Metarhizium acridum]
MTNRPSGPGPNAGRVNNQGGINDIGSGAEYTSQLQTVGRVALQMTAFYRGFFDLPLRGGNNELMEAHSKVAAGED